MHSRIVNFPPDFICIGAQKACTSWLNLAIKSDKNKSIFIPYLKETFFLNLLEHENSTYPVPLSELHRYIYKTFKRITESYIVSQLHSLDFKNIERWQSEYLEYLFRSLSHYWTGLDLVWYERLFSIAQPGQLLGEITPDYSLLQPAIIEELAAVKPLLKVILITRDPVARDLSQLRMQLLPLIPSPSDEECIEFLDQQHVRNRSDYRSILDRWSDYFPSHSILTFDAAEVSSDPFSTLANISSFLGKILEVEPSVLFSRDNVGSQAWHPSDFVVSHLKHFYGL